MKFFLNLSSRYRGASRDCARFAVNPTLAIGVALALSAPVGAQPAPTSPVAPAGHVAHAARTPNDPVSLQFRSVFDGYQSFRDEKVGSWRDANDTVNRVGGWREYLKEAQRAEPTPSRTPSAVPGATPAPSSKPDPHAGHGAKK